MTDRDPARLDYERLADALPEHVVRAVADAVTPQEIGAHNSAISELVHRVMVVTYNAAVSGESSTEWALRWVSGDVTVVEAVESEKRARALVPHVLHDGQTGEVACRRVGPWVAADEAGTR